LGLSPNTTFEVTINGNTTNASSTKGGVLTFVDGGSGSRQISIGGGIVPPDPTFEDVPFSHPYHDYIEAIYQAGYVAGCSAEPLKYCPEGTMNRGESAVFVERGIHGAGYLPPQPSEPVFADVPLWEWFAKWANGLWVDGFTAGCGTNPLIYCPLQPHSKAEGAVFFLRMMHGSDYQPPAPSGIFVDVDVGMWYAKWVEAAWDAGIAEPCLTAPELRYCPDDPLTRALGAYMMAKAKGLAIP
jgi:hypothetical protein